MTEINLQIIVLLVVFWSSSIFIGWKFKDTSRSMADFLLGNRKIGFFVFIFATSSILITNINFLSQPNLNLDIGFMGSYLVFVIIIIAIASIFFQKKQWVLGKRFGYITPSEMYGDYFKSKSLQLIIIFIAVLFVVPFAGLQIFLSGQLLSVISNNIINPISSSWIIGSIMCIYIALGGIKSVAYNNAIKFLLIIFGFLILGLISYNLTGGFTSLNINLAKLSSLQETGTNKTLSLFYIPEIIKLNSGFNMSNAEINWTGTLMFTLILSAVGIYTSPAFSMWCFSSENPKPFASQQVWISCFLIGFILVFFVTFFGISGHLLGSNALVNDAGINISKFLSTSINKTLSSTNLLTSYGFAIKETSQWLFAILIIGAFAIFQSTASAFIATTSGILSRDIYKKIINSAATQEKQILITRISVLLIILSSLTLITFFQEIIWILNSFAISLAFQMIIPLIAICYFPWFTKNGIIAGLVGSFVVLILTDPVGHFLLQDILPWGPWPLTIHSSFWAVIFNLTIAITISYTQPNSIDRVHRQKYFDYLEDQAGIPFYNRYLIPAVLTMGIIFIFFGFGPGAVIGNELFGSAKDPSTWSFGMPSIWVWQILFWSLFVGLAWFLAYKLGLSTDNENNVVALKDDFGDR